MSATIKALGKNYTIDGYKWSGPDKGMVRIFNSYLDPDGPSGADPNPDATAAFELAKTLGLKVVKYDKLDYVPGRVY